MLDLNNLNLNQMTLVTPGWKQEKLSTYLIGMHSQWATDNLSSLALTCSHGHLMVHSAYCPHETRLPNYEVIVQRFVVTQYDLQGTIIASCLDGVQKTVQAMGCLGISIETIKADRLTSSAHIFQHGPLAIHSGCQRAIDSHHPIRRSLFCFQTGIFKISQRTACQRSMSIIQKRNWR